MQMNTSEVRNRGMECLVEGMGLIDAEYFISVLLREKFDYTKWQREYFDRMPAEEFHKQAVAYGKAHPYDGNAKVIIE